MQLINSFAGCMLLAGCFLVDSKKVLKRASQVSQAACEQSWREMPAISEGDAVSATECQQACNDSCATGGCSCDSFNASNGECFLKLCGEMDYFMKNESQLCEEKNRISNLSLCEEAFDALGLNQGSPQNRSYPDGPNDSPGPGGCSTISDPLQQQMYWMPDEEPGSIRGDAAPVCMRPYVKMELVWSEGTALPDADWPVGKTLEQCEELCDNHTDCNSFTFCVDPNPSFTVSVTSGCHLKDRCVSKNDALSPSPQSCSTYRKHSSASCHTTTTTTVTTTTTSNSTSGIPVLAGSPTTAATTTASTTATTTATTTTTGCSSITTSEEACRTAGCTWYGSSCQACSEITVSGFCSMSGCTWTGSSCQACSSFTAEACSSHTGCAWNGSSCQACSPITTLEVCRTSGCTWDGSSCQACSSITTSEAACLTSNCTWDGSSCQACSSIMVENSCSTSGCTWDGSSCQAATTTQTQTTTIATIQTTIQPGTTIQSTTTTTSATGTTIQSATSATIQPGTTIQSTTTTTSATIQPGETIQSTTTTTSATIQSSTTTTSAVAVCTVPSTDGYNFDAAGGDRTMAGFAPQGVECSPGYDGSVVYSKCTSPGTAYSVSGCQLTTTTTTSMTTTTTTTSMTTTTTTTTASTTSTTTTWTTSTATTRTTTTSTSATTTTTTPSTTTTSSTNCAYFIDGGGWTLVRHTASSGTWGPWTDNLAGTDNLPWTGIPGDATSGDHWTIPWDSSTYSRYLFALGDCQQWLITEKAEVDPQFGNRTILSSSSTAAWSRAYWYNRATYQEEPWISTLHHDLCTGLGSQLNCMLYGEGSENQFTDLKNQHGGANVYVRQACAQSIDSGGWTLVRHTAGSGTWPWNDNLTGTETSGGLPSSISADHSWTVPWDSRIYSQYLFALGDCEQWLITDKTQIDNPYDSNSTILKSSSSPTMSTSAAWVKPWISRPDNSDCVSPGNCTLYGEGSNPYQPEAKYGHGGANVYVRHARYTLIGHNRACKSENTLVSGEQITFTECYDACLQRSGCLAFSISTAGSDPWCSLCNSTASSAHFSTPVVSAYRLEYCWTFKTSALCPTPECRWTPTLECQIADTVHVTKSTVVAPFVLQAGEYAEIPNHQGTGDGKLVFLVKCAGSGAVEFKAEVEAQAFETVSLQLDDQSEEDWNLGSGNQWFWSDKSLPVSITEGIHNVTLLCSGPGIKIRALRFDQGQTEAGCYWQDA